VQFVSAESGRVYEAEDVALAEVAAGRIAEALDNMWLTEQHQTHLGHPAASIAAAEAADGPRGWTWPCDPPPRQ